MQKLPEADRIMNALERSVGFGLHMSGSLLSIEFANSASLKKFYGGGYEIAVSEMGKFKKIDDVTYAFWWAQVDGPNLRGGEVPSRAFRYWYKDDLLCIRSVAIDNSGPQARGRDQLLLVPPVFRDVRADEVADTTRPTLNARWLCNYCLVSFANGQGGILTKIDYKADGQQLVRFEDVEGGVNVSASPEFLEDMGQRILREFGIGDI